MTEGGQVMTATAVLEDARLDETFAALANPTRRAILARLAAGEASVNELAEPFNMKLPAISRHIKVLEQAGLVQRRIAGREHWLRVDWSALQLGYEWLHFYQLFWGKRLDALVDYVKNNQDKANKKKGK